MGLGGWMDRYRMLLHRHWYSATYGIWSTLFRGQRRTWPFYSKQGSSRISYWESRTIGRLCAEARLTHLPSSLDVITHDRPALQHIHVHTRTTASEMPKSSSPALAAPEFRAVCLLPQSSASRPPQSANRRQCTECRVGCAPRTRAEDMLMGEMV
jgi:hypothetical protein